MLSLLLSALLGTALGVQREVAGKPAGFRTYALVSLGACLFTLLSQTGFGVGPGIDPSRVAAQVVVGIGFLGAGLIFVRGGHVEGLTTAAGLWVAAAIGMAVGVGEIVMAVVTTVIAFLFLSVGKKLQPERWMRRSRDAQ